MDVATPSVHEPVLFQTARDPLGASYLGWYLLPYIIFLFLCHWSVSCMCGLIGHGRVQNENCLLKKPLQNSNKNDTHLLKDPNKASSCKWKL